MWNCSKLEKSCSGLGTNKQNPRNCAYALMETGSKWILCSNHRLQNENPNDSPDIIVWEGHRHPWPQVTSQSLTEPARVLVVEGVWQWSTGGGIVTLFGKCSLTASPCPPEAGRAGGSQHCAAIVNSLGFWVKVGLVLRRLTNAVWSTFDLILSGQH